MSFVLPCTSWICLHVDGQALKFVNAMAKSAEECTRIINSCAVADDHGREQKYPHEHLSCVAGSLVHVMFCGLEERNSLLENEFQFGARMAVLP